MAYGTGLMLTHAPFACTLCMHLGASGFFYIETEYFNDNTVASNLLEGNALETFLP